MSETKERTRKSAPDFIQGYVKGCNDGLTSPELALSLGMQENSMYQRANQLRKDAKAIGKKFPYPKGTGGTSAEDRKRATVDLLTSLLDDIDDSDNVSETEE